MIYLFHGSDEYKVRTKAFEWVAAARKKQPGLAYARLAREEITPAVLEDAALSGGLFIKRLLVLLDDPFPRTRADVDEEEGESEVDTSSILEEYIDILAQSDNAIVILAPKLLSAKAKKISAKAEKEYKFDKTAAAFGSRGFNGNLVNALAAHDAKKLWLETVRALRTGDAPEMLHGLLHWKARDLMEKGHPEGRRLSLALLKLLQESRRTGGTLNLALEKFALSV